MVFVANFYRPLTRNAQEALEVMREIEVASGIKFTAIINNSNVGAQTTAHDVLQTVGEVTKLSELCNVPVIMTTAVESVANELKNRLDNIFPLTLQEKYYDIKL